jgi:hypothetical protein
MPPFNPLLSTPYDSMVHLVKNHDNGISQIKYAQIIGSLMFLTTCIRFDISWPVLRHMMLADWVYILIILWLSIEMLSLDF